MRAGLVNQLRFIENIQKGLDFCEILISDIPYKLFGVHSDYVKFIGHKVLFDTRPDLYRGKVIEVISNIAEERVIQTVAENKGVKLIPDNSSYRSVCGYELGVTRQGDTLRDVICYVSTYERNTSDNAEWFDLVVVDMVSKVNKIRYFTKKGQQSQSDEDIIRGYVGKYVKFDMVTNTKYGLQANSAELLSIDVSLAPEVEVAVGIINEAVSGDIELMNYIQKFDAIEKLKWIIEIEPGFHLVRIATEIILIKALSNVTDIYSEKELIRAAVTSRGYLIDRKNDLSKVVLNINKILRSLLSTDIILIDCLDVMSGSTNELKRVYIKIANFANFIVDERRGLFNEKEVISKLAAISDMYGRLL